MQRTLGILLVGCLLAVVTVQTATAEVFIESKLGRVKLDDSSHSDPLNLALGLGYQLDNTVADLSIVGEINRTIDEGHAPGGEDVKFSANGIYLRWISIRSLFVTLRAGLVENELQVSGDSETSSGLALGAGFGVVVGKTRWHLEYLNLAGDASFFSLGIEF